MDQFAIDWSSFGKDHSLSMAWEEFGGDDLDHESWQLLNNCFSLSFFKRQLDIDKMAVN